jgi:hypothetical protein
MDRMTQTMIDTVSDDVERNQAHFCWDCGEPPTDQCANCYALVCDLCRADHCECAADESPDGRCQGTYCICRKKMP